MTCRCTWDRYDLTCPHLFHKAIALRTIPTARIVREIPANVPNYVPAGWTR